MISFWCKKCELDLDLEAEKQNNSYAEWFMARCPKCGVKLLRYITEKHKDPYYHESKRVKIQSRQYAKDLIQPGQDGFKLYYKKEWDKMEQAKEDYEKKRIAKKKDRDEFYKKYAASGMGMREAIKRVVTAEEAMDHGGK